MPFPCPADTEHFEAIRDEVEGVKARLGFERLVADAVTPRVMSRLLTAEQWAAVRPHFERKLHDHFNPELYTHIARYFPGSSLDIKGLDVSDQKAAYTTKGHDLIRSAFKEIVETIFGPTIDRKLRNDCHYLLFFFVKKAI